MIEKRKMNRLGVMALRAILVASLLTLVSGAAGANGGGVPAEGRTILAIYAHPDDEVSAAPVLSRYAREGATVKLAIVTDGGPVRDLEALCSTEALGADPPILMGFEDGGTPDQMRQIKGALQALFAEIQPDVVMTWGPEGGYGHKDHRIVGAIVSDIFQAGGEGVPDAVYFAGVPHFVFDDFAPTSPRGIGFKFVWGRSDIQYLRYQIRFNDEDRDAAVAAAACHPSQFSPEFVQDVGNFFDVHDHKIYLRNSHAKGRKRSSLLDPPTGFFEGSEWGDDD
jgi:LmbE family N-acetylglucosaminyl deacetylase